MLILMSSSTLEKSSSVLDVAPAAPGTASGRVTTGKDSERITGLLLAEHVGSLATFRRWYWALVPLFTIAAYFPVLRIGFLSEDMGLNRIAQGEEGLQALLPNGGLRFYRPVGFLLTYRINWPIFGLNPFPYHLEGLLVHAAAAWVLGLWLADITGKRWLGWLAGALFGVFPLNMEAVGWLATQWDLWAALFGVLSVWLFSKWWRGDGGGKWGLYAGSVLFYFLGIFTKESLFTFIPIIALSAWYVLPPKVRQDWLKLGLALTPHALVLGLNLLIRQIAWGEQRNYAGSNVDYLGFIYDAISERLKLLLGPLETIIFGPHPVQIVATLSLVGLLVGLVLYGRAHYRLLALAGAWILLTLLPVLNIGIVAYDFQNSRLLYLVSAGYCIVVATLLWSAISAAKKVRWPFILGTGLALVGCVSVAWAHLEPWHIASLQAREVESELERLIPMQKRPQGMTWYVQGVPSRYRGAWVLHSGIARTRYMPGGEADIPQIVNVERGDTAPLSSTGRDAFAITWDYDSATARWHVEYGMGIIAGSPPPEVESNTGSNLQVWDFRTCDTAAIEQWYTQNAAVSCSPGRGLLLQPTTADPALTNASVNIVPSANGDRHVRLRASVSLKGPVTAESLIQVFWLGANDTDGYKQRNTQPASDGAAHVYWVSFVPKEPGEVINNLRIDPINSVTPVELHWIAVDTVR